MQKLSTLMQKENNNNLKKAFMKACADKDFYQYISTIDVNEDVLMQYTSILQESYIEKKNCASCQNLEECPNHLKGCYYQPEVLENRIVFSYVACKKYNQYMEKKKNIDSFSMPKQLEQACFKEIYKDDKARVPIIKYFKQFMEDYQEKKKSKGLYLTGSFGSGKTYLIAALFNEMAKKEVKSYLVYYPELLRSLKASFSTNDFEEIFQNIKQAPLLLLDDIGAENTTAWSRDEVLGPILQYRMEEDLPTFFTSNLTLEELEEALSIHKTEKVKARRIIERIKYLTTSLSLVSKNRREE